MTKREARAVNPTPTTAIATATTTTTAAVAVTTTTATDPINMTDTNKKVDKLEWPVCLNILPYFLK